MAKFFGVTSIDSSKWGRPTSAANIIALSLIVLGSVEAQPPSPHGIESLVSVLTSEDPVAYRNAATALANQGPDVVAPLFDRMVISDWDLKPRLMEVLNEHGREYAAKKMLEGTADQKAHAAILYELIGGNRKPTSREHRMMVRNLLEGLASKDKYLRTWAAIALVHQEQMEGVQGLWQHYYELVPALVECIDTPVYLNRRAHFDPFVVPIYGVGITLDMLIGDRLACSDLTDRLEDIDEKREDGATPATDQRRLKALIDKNRKVIDDLKNEWRQWWLKHGKQDLRQIGAMMIERNLAMLPEREMTLDEYNEAPRERAHEYYARIKHVEIIKGSLDVWTGQDFQYAQEWRAWWKNHRESYDGPKVSPNDDHEDD